MNTSEQGHVTTLLFDLGGVLIELGSLEQVMQGSPRSADSIWQGWISSPSVRLYESGGCSDDEFARNMIKEFDLALDESEFLARFSRWPTGPFPGALELLQQLGNTYQLACLSNSNPAHFTKFLDRTPLMNHFDATFLSFQTGVLKPDREAFMQVLESLELTPTEVLFFDDNAHNVAAAQALGIRAEQANAPNDVLDRLNGLGMPV